MTMVVTPVFTVAFVRHLFKGDEKGKYSVCAIWTPKRFQKKDKERWTAMLETLDVACKETFGKKRLELPGNYKKCIRDGEEKEGMDGFGEGTQFATLSSLEAPKVTDMHGNVIAPSQGNADEIWAGCLCVAAVAPYTFANESKGVALGIRSMKKVGDGRRIDTSGAADKMLEDVEIDEVWLDAQDDEIPY